MSPSSPNLTELAVEILERIFLHLSGQDIIKMESVRRIAVKFRLIVVDFVPYDLGQPTLARPHS